MSVLLWITLGFNLLATCVMGVIALQKRPQGAYDDAELRSKVRQLDADIDDLFDRVKRLTSRKGMQAKRAEDAENPYRRLPDETDAAWKARARKLRNNGIEPMKET